MLDLFNLAEEIQNKFTERGFSFCSIGGLALQAWGENRVTQDVDISLFTAFKDENLIFDYIMKLYPERITGAKDFALKG